MFMKTSFYSFVAVLLCSAFSPAMAQTTAPSSPPMPSAQAPAPMETSTDAPAGSTEITAAIEETPVPVEPAKSSSDKKPKYYDDHGNPYNTYEYYEVQPQDVLIALQRDPSLPTGHFVLFMTVGQPFVGCTKVINPKHSTKFENKTMIIEVEKFAVDERDMPRYAHYECNTSPKEPIARVNLSRDQLIENDVKQIKFRTEKTTVKYNVKITDNYIQLISDSRVPPDRNRFRPLWVDGVSNTLKFWFYPENTVILTADGASKDITIESKLMELASAKGLTPLDDLMPEHTHFRKRADSYYFIDKQGRYKVSTGELFDYIQADAMKFGLEADEPVKKNVAVFIRKPGQYE